MCFRRSIEINTSVHIETDTESHRNAKNIYYSVAVNAKTKLKSYLVLLLPQEFIYRN